MSRWLAKPALSQQNRIQQERSLAIRSRTEEGLRRYSESDPEQRIECLQSPLKAGEMIPEQQTEERDLSTTAVLKHVTGMMHLKQMQCQNQLYIFQLVKQKHYSFF